MDDTKNKQIQVKPRVIDCSASDINIFNSFVNDGLANPINILLMIALRYVTLLYDFLVIPYLSLVTALVTRHTSLIVCYSLFVI